MPLFMTVETEGGSAMKGSVTMKDFEAWIPLKSMRFVLARSGDDDVKRTPEEKAREEQEEEKRGRDEEIQRSLAEEEKRKPEGTRSKGDGKRARKGRSAGEAKG